MVIKHFVLYWTTEFMVKSFPKRVSRGYRLKSITVLLKMGLSACKLDKAASKTLVCNFDAYMAVPEVGRAFLGKL